MNLDAVTKQLAAWLADEPNLCPLHPNGTPRTALLTDPTYVRQLNADVRNIIAEWPEDEWIIGEDGAGNYFCVSRSESHSGIRQFDHEWKRFEDFMPTLHAYFDYFADIARRTDSRHPLRDG